MFPGEGEGPGEALPSETQKPRSVDKRSLRKKKKKKKPNFVQMEVNESNWAEQKARPGVIRC